MNYSTSSQIRHFLQKKCKLQQILNENFPVQKVESICLLPENKGLRDEEFFRRNRVVLMVLLNPHAWNTPRILLLRKQLEQNGFRAVEFVIEFRSVFHDSFPEKEFNDGRRFAFQAKGALHRLRGMARKQTLHRPERQIALAVEMKIRKNQWDSRGNLPEFFLWQRRTDEDKSLDTNEFR